MTLEEAIYLTDLYNLALCHYKAFYKVRSNIDKGRYTSQLRREVMERYAQREVVKATEYAIDLADAIDCPIHDTCEVVKAKARKAVQ